MSDAVNDAKIIDSWLLNASPWVAAIRENRVESRVLVTNNAIVEAIIGRQPNSLLDIGCGEGWLIRAVTELNPKIRAMGIDVVPELIDHAARAGRGDFRVGSYETIASGKLGVTFDIAVANFALLGKNSVDVLLHSMGELLNARGAFIIQTVHPVMACGDFPYQDGWRTGSWAGFSSDFRDPAPWYFRTIESWVKLFAENGLTLVEMREPLHPTTQKPASVIFVAETTT